MKNNSPAFLVTTKMRRKASFPLWSGTRIRKRVGSLSIFRIKPDFLSEKNNKEKRKNYFITLLLPTSWLRDPNSLKKRKLGNHHPMYATKLSFFFLKQPLYLLINIEFLIRLTHFFS